MGSPLQGALNRYSWGTRTPKVWKVFEGIGSQCPDCIFHFPSHNYSFPILAKNGISLSILSLNCIVQGSRIYLGSEQSRNLKYFLAKKYGSRSNKRLSDINVCYIGMKFCGEVDWIKELKEKNYINFPADKEELELGWLYLKWMMVFILVRILWRNRTSRM